MMYVVIYYKNTALNTQKIISNNIYSRSTTGFTKTDRKLRFNKEFTSTLSTRKGDL
jgi:flagellar basal body rod protein FlgF